MKALLFLLVPALLCQLAVAETKDTVAVKGGEPSELKNLRFEFQVKLADLYKPLKELNAGYREYLEKQKKVFQEEGKLKPMLAVDEELKTFESDPAGDLSTISELKRLQEIYRKQRAAREKELADPRLELIAGYRKEADGLAVEWTKGGRIEEAKLALGEAERLAALEKDAELAKKAGETMASGPAGRTGSNFEGKAAGEELKNGLGMKLCWIPAGSFTMGSPEDEAGRANNENQVKVRLTRGYWMGKYEVTQGEYERVAGNNPSHFNQAGKQAPVEKVTWEDAVAFCKKLTESERKKGKLAEGWAYTLPTEAQWEYACRAEDEETFSGGELDEVGWYRVNSGGKTHEVGEKKPNAWGLHDMHGNVREFCEDWKSNQLVGGRDPTGLADGSDRVTRGGDWNNDPRLCRAAYRGAFPPGGIGSGLGFRVCLSSND